jgi:hypothetical protein
MAIMNAASPGFQHDSLDLCLQGFLKLASSSYRPPSLETKTDLFCGHTSQIKRTASPNYVL